MTEFINWGLVVLSGIMVVAAIVLIANEKKKQRSYIYLTTTIIFFLMVLIGFPYILYQQAKDNIESFKRGKMLQCYSSSGIFGSSEQYMIAKDQWDQKDFNFIKKDNRLVIKANHCE